MRTVFTIALVALALGVAAAPAAADHNRHVTPDGALRAPAPARDPAIDLDVRIDRRGFRLGGRLHGLDRSYGAWLGGEIDDRGLTLDGQVEGGRGWRLRVDAERLEGAARDVGIAARQLARGLAQRFLTDP